MTSDLPAGLPAVTLMNGDYESHLSINLPQLARFVDARIDARLRGLAKHLEDGGRRLNLAADIYAYLATSKPPTAQSAAPAAPSVREDADDEGHAGDPGDIEEVLTAAQRHAEWLMAGKPGPHDNAGLRGANKEAGSRLMTMISDGVFRPALPASTAAPDGDSTPLPEVDPPQAQARGAVAPAAPAPSGVQDALRQAAALLRHYECEPAADGVERASAALTEARAECARLRADCDAKVADLTVRADESRTAGFREGAVTERRVLDQMLRLNGRIEVADAIKEWSCPASICPTAAPANEVKT